MNKVLRAWIAIGAIAACSGSVVAQDERGNTAAPEEPGSDASSVLPDDIESPDDVPIDEIIVLGEKTVPQLRREIRAVEMEINDLFNASNPDSGYDIVCRTETRIGSQIPRTNCKARVYWEALSELAEEDEGTVRTNQPLMMPARHAEVLRQKMLEQAEENPKLLQALVRRKLLQREIQGRKAD